MLTVLQTEKDILTTNLIKFIRKLPLFDPLSDSIGIIKNS